MSARDKPICIAITGASGFCYGLRLLECLLAAGETVYLCISDAARSVAAIEDNVTIPGQTDAQKQFFIEKYSCHPEKIFVFSKHEWTAPIASGSSQTKAMVVCPCSSGALAAIAHGTSDTLIERAADVMLKEGRQLILVSRESPLSMIHLENMLALSRAGAMIVPASPGFYHQPKQISDLIDFVVARVLNLLAIPQQLLSPWGR